MKFTVDRRYWRCGNHAERASDQDDYKSHGEFVTMLRNPHDQLMCCLGHCLAQCGVSAKDLDRSTTPRQLHPSAATMGKEIFWVAESGEPGVRFENSDLADHAIFVNDSSSETIPQREKELMALFAKHGHELVFEGEFQKELLH